MTRTILPAHTILQYNDTYNTTIQMTRTILQAQYKRHVTYTSILQMTRTILQAHTILQYNDTYNTTIQMTRSILQAQYKWHVTYTSDDTTGLTSTILRQHRAIATGIGPDIKFAAPSSLGGTVLAWPSARAVWQTCWCFFKLEQSPSQQKVTVFLLTCKLLYTEWAVEAQHPRRFPHDKYT